MWCCGVDILFQLAKVSAKTVAEQGGTQVLLKTLQHMV
jgi:hypothetical protein